MSSIAQHIVDKLGGVEPTSELAEVSVHTVWRWLRAEGRSGGLGGDIPRPARRRLLENAGKAGIDLTDADFVPPELRRAS